jgi:(1->4)-alpha-D-glucan 1-alpha-D-glucosylmutase
VQATYRVQVRPDFDLAATAELTDYLATLGVSHLYCAPLLQAAPGSAHGYDVVDHSRVNAELGGEPGRLALMAALRRRGLGLVVDIVPNHAGIAVPAANPAWWDVLRLGRGSRYASWFDIDWERAPILVPVLADDPHAADALRIEDGELRYYEHRFPIAPGTGDGTPRQVHERQHYRLVSWRRADTEINYRRFFAVNTLVALRVEDPEVFRGTHREVLRWYAGGGVDGIRVDHPDGLRDPAGYLGRLRTSAPEAWLVVEKILEHGEELPDWPVAGTTGYDALRVVCGLFVDAAAEPAFTALDAELTSTGARDATGATVWAELRHEAKLTVATTQLRAELRRLVRLAAGAGEQALAELLACFDVYRSYLPDGAGHLADAAAQARHRRPDLTPDLDAVLPRLREPAQELAIRFQQVCGAVMAKGVEDTALYRWTRFVALNEVGGDPAAFGVGVEEFHAACRARLDHWPTTMTTLSTHDTKRGEDVRARLAVLSEMPEDWAGHLRRWMRAAPVPDAALAHLLWQTVAGAWPIERDRLQGYAVKAAREAATSTRWEDPDEEFERAVRAAVDAAYDDPAVCAEVTRFAAGIAPFGWSNSLGQKLIQLTMPGVPDTYQGTELQDNSLVDPDNRRPVDFALRRELLARLDAGWLPPVDASGAAKLLVTSRALRLRRDHPALFTGHRPVYADGPAAEHAVAFDRGGAITVATRLPLGLHRRGGWDDTTLTLPRSAADALTGQVHRPGAIRLAELLRRYPVALLVGSDIPSAASGGADLS